MPTPEQALAAALRRPDSVTTAGSAHVLMVGARGPLGAAVLEHLLGASGFGRVEVAVVRPLTALPRGLHPVAARQVAGRLHLERVRAHDAVLVFDRERRVNGRDDAFLPARPGELEPIAAALHAAGVRRLTLVTPQDNVTTPAALRAGLATIDEQRVAALGFDALVFVRASDEAASRTAASWPQRVADGVLRQLRFMVPQPLQPLRTPRLAAIATAVAGSLARTHRRGTRVMPTELVWQAAQLRHPGPLVDAWLAGETLPEATVRVGRL
ncbi:MAG: hypothetical protein MUC74_13830 [Ideonella sp.]|jgi:hypothetical protein|nr:hypothetical protein [Ideonella sp.]